MVCRNAYPPLTAYYPANALGGEIFLADMHSIEISSQTQIGVIIHDETNPRARIKTRHSPHLARLGQNLFCTPALIPELDQRCATAY